MDFEPSSLGGYSRCEQRAMTISRSRLETRHRKIPCGTHLWCESTRNIGSTRCHVLDKRTILVYVSRVVILINKCRNMAVQLSRKRAMSSSFSCCHFVTVHSSLLRHTPPTSDLPWGLDGLRCLFSASLRLRELSSRDPTRGVWHTSYHTPQSARLTRGLAQGAEGWCTKFKRTSASSNSNLPSCNKSAHSSCQPQRSVHESRRLVQSNWNEMVRRRARTPLGTSTWIPPSKLFCIDNGDRSHSTVSLPSSTYLHPRGTNAHMLYSPQRAGQRHKPPAEAI
ncbi:hypothetical protein BJ546DRAFT_120172 [Cryomyces antarcticus]